VLSAPLGGILKITDAARLVLYLVYADLKCDIFVALQPRSPEVIFYVDFGEFNGGDEFVGGDIFAATRCERQAKAKDKWRMFYHGLI
jgi:hypothetical protein